jgi:hypothetical protein
MMLLESILKTCMNGWMSQYLALFDLRTMT